MRIIPHRTKGSGAAKMCSSGVLPEDIGLDPDRMLRGTRARSCGPRVLSYRQSEATIMETLTGNSGNY